MKTRRPRPTVFERLVRASHRSAGIRLNASEVNRVASLADVWTLAQLDREAAEATIAARRNADVLTLKRWDSEAAQAAVAARRKAALAAKAAQ